MSAIADNRITTDHSTKALRDHEPALTYRGYFRVYLLGKEHSPRVIVISNGTHAWEVRCKSVEIKPAILSKIDLHSDPPIWMEGFGLVSVDASGNAKISV